MFLSNDFHRLKYHFQKHLCPGQEIESVTGFDSEADETGKPFLFCASDKSTFTLDSLFPSLFSKYIGVHFAVWNLKYDSGAILYELPVGAVYYEEDLKTIKGFAPGKYELWTTNETTWFYYTEPGRRVDIRLKYIPHKLLKLSLSKNQNIYFWDICQFYASGLDDAARTYLGERKMEVETKKFTKEYRQKHKEKIITYCIRDAQLTESLGNLLIRKIKTFGFRLTALYSQASVSFRYFQDNGEIIGIPRFMKHYPELVKGAIDAYQGGKFEITARGRFQKAYEYDVISAYPYEIANLVNINHAKVKHSKKYQPSAYYGFLRCHVEIYDSVSVPCGLLIKNTRVYAIGKYFVDVTKAEYEYLIELGAKVEIISAWWLFIDNLYYPYRDSVMKLFALKSKYKKEGNKMLTLLCKVMANGFYGKFCQAIENWKGEIEAGMGFNPIYAAVITANVRLKVCRLQNLYKEKCFAVHTDSVMLTEKLSPEYAPEKPGLGQFEYVTEGPGILVACGCYQIGDAGAFKGFKPYEKQRDIMTAEEIELVKSGGEVYENWYDILKQYPGKRSIPYKVLRVESWIEATGKRHFDKINLFQNMSKDISLNADIKRIWLKNDMTAGDYLRELHHSEPRVIVHHEIPEYWKI